MGKSNRFAFVYLVIGIAFLFGWTYVQNLIWPPPPPVKVVKGPDAVGLWGGASAFAAVEANAPELAEVERKANLPNAMGAAGGSAVTVAVVDDIPGQVAAESLKQAATRDRVPDKLIALGKGEKPFHLQVLLNEKGGAVQQVILTHFDQADREGLPVKNPDGTRKHLHLIPGVRVPRTPEIRDQRGVPIPELKAGMQDGVDPTNIEHTSYTLYHYDREGDAQPVNTLGERSWTVAVNESTDDKHVVAFETTLGAPHFVKITKTFTLHRGDYHLGMSVRFEPAGRPAGARAEPFRYQIDGPRGLPIEGEWYTTTYRQGIVGYPDSRALELPQNVRHAAGSDAYRASDRKPIRYAGVMIQYFASVMAVDNEPAPGTNRDTLDFVRFTAEGPAHKDEKEKLDQTFLDDVTFRAVSKPIDPAVAVEHRYVLYQGPVKVRLLKQLEGERAVAEETVDRYRDELHLKTLTDAPMPNFFGRVSNFLFWTDILIFFTNLVHSLLGLLSHVIPNLGLCIIVITIMVRGCLHPFSRKQLINAKIMQAKQEKIAPEMKALAEKYKDDMQTLNAEKFKLYKKHGINPAAMMGGCLLLLMQMPIFMGLYYALQESVFFRLENVFGDTWIPNLAAPDMLLWWGEGIPFLSRPADLGGTIYLGPYLNLLPLVAVGLMMYVQSKMMPKSEDPQIQMQQKMMKIMMIVMLFFFYKVAAGLCIYFICSSVWGMIERKLIPKNIAIPEDKPKDKDAPEKPKGWLGNKMAGWKEKWDKVLEEAQKQQQLQREERPGNNGGKKKKR